jgi:hypothetical protein
MEQEQQSQIKQLISKGKEQGFLTYAEVNDHLPDGILEPEQIEDVIRMINDMGISVYETAPDMEAHGMSEVVIAADDDEAEATVAALASVDSEFGRTTDPVRMYMREMGTVELLTREGELQIAKRIEEGLAQVVGALATYPDTIARFLEFFDRIGQEETARLRRDQRLRGRLRRAGGGGGGRPRRRDRGRRRPVGRRRRRGRGRQPRRRQRPLGRRGGRQGGGAAGALPGLPGGAGAARPRPRRGAGRRRPGRRGVPAVQAAAQHLRQPGGRVARDHRQHPRL